MKVRHGLLLSIALSLCACHDNAAAPDGFAGLGQDAALFSQVEKGRALAFPKDHGAHDGYRIEWWYVTTNLSDASGREWGAQWTLFRTALRAESDRAGWGSPNVWLAHAALTGPNGHYFAEKTGRGGIGQAGVDASPFKAWIDDWSLTSTAGQGVDHLQMQASGKGFGYRLELDADGPLVLHGADGYSEKSGQGQASYYYSQPFYRVQGEVELSGERIAVKGVAWLDREWSSQPLTAEQEGWDWFSLHLDGGAKLMLFQVRDTDGGHYRAGTWIGADGRSQSLASEQISLEETKWTRQGNGRQVPTSWHVRLPGHAIDVRAEAVQPQSWMGGRFEYWEGPIRLTGSHTGRGYLEMTGY